MFLALCPFSEIVCLISVMMAWLYIGLGILGNHQITDSTKEKILLHNVEHSESLSVSKAQNYFWFENEITRDIDFDKIATNHKSFIPVALSKNIEYQPPIKLIHLNRYKPDRAPPAFS